MKRILITALIVISGLALTVNAARLKSRKLWNAEVPNAAIQLDTNDLLQLIYGLNLDEDADIDFDAADEEFDITSSSGVTSGDGILKVINSDTDVTVQQYLLRLIHRDTSSGSDTDADFAVFQSSASGSEVDWLTVASNGVLIGSGSESLDLGNATDGTILFTDGTNTLLTIADSGTSGTVSAAVLEADTINEDGASANNVTISTNVVISGTLTQTGAASLSSTLSVGAATNLYSRTEAELKAITPAAVGELYFDSTNVAVVVSTGTSAGQFGIIYDGTTKPTGW